MVYDFLREICGENIEFKPEAFLLGILSKDIGYYKRCIFLNVTTAARILLARNWKKNLIPGRLELIDLISETVELELLYELVQYDNLSRAKERWKLWFVWWENGDAKEYKQSNKTRSLL